MKKRLKWVVGLIVLAVGGMQLAIPSHQNPPVEAGHDLFATNAPPPAVAALLRNSCYDCHSFETKWPWYSYVAPISWYVVRDVKAGRAAMNFSDWPQDDAKRARKRWRHIADEVASGDMPMANYTRIHRETRLDEQQRAALVKWAKEQAGD